MAARDYLFIKNGEKIVFMGETWGDATQWH